MKSAFFSFLLFSLFFAFSTLGGMAVLAMDGPGHTEHGSTTDCLEHCLAVAESVSTVVTPFPLILSVIVAAIILFVPVWLRVDPVDLFLVQRWREGIGKLLRQQQLATVLLRD